MTCVKIVEIVANLADYLVRLSDPLAWPIVSLIIFWRLRHALEKLIPFIETVKIPGVEMSLRKSVDDAGKTVEQLYPDTNIDAEYQPPEPIDQDPRMAIIKSWASVEEGIAVLTEAAFSQLTEAHRQQFAKNRRTSTYRRIEMLRQASVIDNQMADILQEMRDLRNLIAHGKDIPVDFHTVRTFLGTTTRLASIVNRQIDSAQPTRD